MAASAPITLALAWNSRVRYFGSRKNVEYDRPKQNCTHSMSTKGFVNSASDSLAAELVLGVSSARLGLGLGCRARRNMAVLSISAAPDRFRSLLPSTLRLVRGRVAATQQALVARTPAPNSRLKLAAMEGEVSHDEASI